MAGRYRAIAPAVVRTESRADSEVADPPRLEVGAEIEVTATERVRSGKRGTVNRLQFEGGWVSERAKSGVLLLERLDTVTGQAAPNDAEEADEIETDQQDDSPAIICVMKAVQKLQVQDGISASSQTIGELQVGDTVGIVEEKPHKGHDRVRIVTQHAEEAWCSRRIEERGDSPEMTQLVVDETLTEARPWIPTHETSVFDELVQFKVLAACTARMGPEKDDTKVGEYSKGTVLDVVQEVTNFKGITTYLSITAIKGKQTGGWVKLETSKGKKLLERIEPDPTLAKCEAEILEFLTSRGHAAITPRVCKALGSGGGEDDPTLWLRDLKEMEADGELEVFLQGCRDTMDTDSRRPLNESKSAEAAGRSDDEGATQSIVLERPPSPRSGGPGFGINLAPDCVVTSFSHEQSCAENAGVEVGSRILEINGTPVSTKDDAVSLLRDTDPGSSVSFLLAGSSGRRWDPTAGKWIGDAEDDSNEDLDGDEEDRDQDEGGAEEDDAGDPLDFSNGPIKFAVLATCTVRDGPDSTAAKVGEHKPGDTIEIVQEASNSDGLKVYQTITAPKGANRGGWVKLKTSKGKELLSVVLQFTNMHEVEKAPDPKEPPRDLVSLQKFFGRIDKVKVKITVDGAGIFVAEDTKEAKKVLSYSTRRIRSWTVKKKNSLVLVASVAGVEDTTTFILKNPEGLEAALAEAAMASCMWKVDSEAWQDDGLTPEEKIEKEKAISAVAKKKQGDEDRVAELRREISDLRLKDLRKKAREVGVPKDTLETATDADQPEGALIEAIVAHALQSKAAEQPEEAEQPEQTEQPEEAEQPEAEASLSVPEPAAGSVPEGEPPQRQDYKIDPISHAELKKKAAQAEALLQEAARLIDWQPGMVIDVDTEDGVEQGVTILGPSSSGNPKEMQVRFADGTVDDWDKEDFVFRGGDAEDDPNGATPRGNAAAIALQREIIKHGTRDVAKISKLRRASLAPADANAAMTAAAAADDDQRIASLERDINQLSDSFAQEKQAHADTKQELEELQEKLAVADARSEELHVATERYRAQLDEEVAAHAATKLESRDKGAALDKLSVQLAALETVHAQTSVQSTAAVEAALNTAAAAQAEAAAARKTLEECQILQHRQQEAALGGLKADADEDLAAKDREIARLQQKINSLEEMMLTDRSSGTLTWNMMDDMLTSDVLLSTDESWT